MAWGARKAERVRFESRYPVNLMGVDGAWRRSCILVDISVTGARLDVDGSIEVLKAEEFLLILSSTGLVRVAGSEVGVRFITERKAKSRAFGHNERFRIPPENW